MDITCSFVSPVSNLPEKKIMWWLYVSRTIHSTWTYETIAILVDSWFIQQLLLNSNMIKRMN